MPASEKPMTEQAPHVRENSPLSWRDVYRALGETEARIVTAINVAVTPLNQASIDHESRIRELERNGSASAQSLANKVDALHRRVDRLEADENALMAREKGILATLSAGQKTILLLGAIIGIIWGFVQIIERVSV